MRQGYMWLPARWCQCQGCSETHAPAVAGIQAAGSVDPNAVRPPSPPLSHSGIETGDCGTQSLPSTATPPVLPLTSSMVFQAV